MELEEGYDRRRGAGRGTEVGYTVEARYNGLHPIQVGHQLFDLRWQQVDFKKSELGVPAAPPYRRRVLENGMLGYPAAQALRWWLHAVAEEMPFSLGLESRIVAHKISYEYSIETVAAHDLVAGEDRSNCIPDWNK